MGQGQRLDIPITIITINKNNANGLKASINSLKAFRDDANFEFIFVDGASADNSLDVAEKFYLKDEIVSEPDRGIYDAMNKGLQRAGGRFVMWLNSGDELVLDDADVLLQHLDLDIDVIAFSVNYSDPNSRKCVLINRPVLSNLPMGMFAHQGLIFRKDACLDVGGYDTRYKIAADRDMLLKLYFSGRQIETCNDVIARFWIGGASSNEFNLKRENLLLDRKYGLITTTQYFWRILRAKNDPLFGGIKRFILGGE